MPGKDEGKPHCTSDIPKSEVLVFVGQYDDSDSDSGEDCDPLAM